MIDCFLLPCCVICAKNVVILKKTIEKKTKVWYTVYINAVMKTAGVDGRSTERPMGLRTVDRARWHFASEHGRSKRAWSRVSPVAVCGGHRYLPREPMCVHRNSGGTAVFLLRPDRDGLFLLSSGLHPSCAFSRENG